MRPMVPFARLPLAFDVAPLLADVVALAGDRWVVHFNQGYHDGGWQGVALRSVDGDAGRLHSDARHAAKIGDTELLRACPAIAAALTRLRCPLRAVRLLRLAAGSAISEHRDDDLRFEDGEARLHIPLVTSPAVEFYVEDRRVMMEAGECWYVDFSRPHRVQNRGERERIHLVIDCGVNEWLAAQIAAGDVVVARSAPASGQETFAAFRAHVLEDSALQARLQAEIGPAEFIARTVALGAEHGFRFGAEDVRAAMAQGRRAWFDQWMA
jgi:mannose-6-phosphate isomerase-like protein (cupin superfamily)